jgi:N-acetylneuraminate lyase
MKIAHLKGLIAAPFTPMDDNGAVNTSFVKSYYEFLSVNNVAGAFICGSTGEGVSLTTKEKIAVAEAWVDCTNNNSQFKVMMFLGGTSITECKEIARHMKGIGVYGISFTAPYYFKPADAKTLAKCCIEIAEAEPDIPFYYYHIPVLTGVAFPMIDLLKEIDGKLPNFAGIKYTDEDFMDFLSCINFKSGKYDMLWGRDESFLSALVLGAKGAVGSTFNYAAPLYHDLIDAFENGDLELARFKQQQSIDMITLLGKFGGIATGKSYMKLVDMDCGEFRLPVKNMTSEQFDTFKKEVAQLGFYSFCSKKPASVLRGK